jgi:hypothetical protein
VIFGMRSVLSDMVYRREYWYMLLVYLVLLVHERHMYMLVTGQWHMLIIGQ